MNWRLLIAAGCVVAFAGVAPSARGETGGEQTTATERVTPVPGTPEAAPAAAATPAPAPQNLSDFDKTVQDIKNPASWFRWGADVRLREEYIKNPTTLENDTDDTINMIRLRTRLWGEFGPVFQDNSLNVPNGLSLYVRFTSEPRFFITRPTTGPLGGGPVPGQPGVNYPLVPVYANPVAFDEIIFDNLYVQWLRPAGIPVDFKVGRQDLTYGRGWLILDGTPLDGSRSLYDDAAKMTVHFDDVKTDVDFFVADNKADERDRLAPITFQVPAQYAQYLDEYDTKLVGAYLKTMYFKPAEIDLYYVYKDDTLVDPFFYGLDSNWRIVHTVGGLVQGPFLDDPSKKTWDYYVEGAYQWGNEGPVSPIFFSTGFPEMRRSDWGLTAELGYTFEDTAWTPRVNAGLEFLSGDEPHAAYWGAWDPVLSCWPESSELLVYRWEFEGRTGAGEIGAWSNMYRLHAGVSAKPTSQMTLSFDYNYILGDYHSFNTGVFTTQETAYGGGNTRGQLLVGKLLYDFNKYLSGHLWAEYFIPGSYYASGADNAVFLRWELMFKF